jgi:hypothetical protein
VAGESVKIPFIRDIKSLIEETQKDIGHSDFGTVKDINADGTVLVELTILHDWSGQPQKMSLRDVPVFSNVGDISPGDRVAIIYMDGDLNKPHVMGSIRYGPSNKDQDIIKWVMALKTIGTN